MSDDDSEPADPVLEVLTDFKERLRVLDERQRLTEEGERTFRELARELERRTGGDRRLTARGHERRRADKDIGPGTREQRG
jgi:hypothetical protein